MTASAQSVARSTAQPVRIGLWRKPAAGSAYSFLGSAPTSAVRPGDELAVKVTNAADHELFLTLFHLGADGSVVRLHPTTGQNQPSSRAAPGLGVREHAELDSWSSAGLRRRAGREHPPQAHRLGHQQETDLRNLCAAPAAHSLGPLDASNGDRQTILARVGPG